MKLFSTKKETKNNELTNTLYFDVTHSYPLSCFKQQLFRLKTDIQKTKRTPVFLCIGSDRATGDCFGPLIGTMLMQQILSQNSVKEPLFQHPPAVYGTLQHPIHAINLEKCLESIYKTYRNPFLFALDASLGFYKHIGYVTLGPGPLLPGIGVKKRLPAVGDIAITGIVNCTGSHCHNILQTTNLSTVVELSKFVTQGITEVFLSHLNKTSYVNDDDDYISTRPSKAR